MIDLVDQKSLDKTANLEVVIMEVGKSRTEGRSAKISTF